MVILRFAGTQAPGYVRRVLRQGRAAGVILFRDNVVSPRSAPRADAPPAPRLPGRSSRWSASTRRAARSGSWNGPAPSGRPATRRPRAPCAPTSLAAGHDLRAGGVNVTLAPVADVPSVNGAALASRAFSSDPERAATAVADAIAGWQDAGVATTVKHFPGLGGATVNTDDGPATIRRRRAELDADLAPFRSAIDAGTEFVMAGHATYPALDGLHIASQSPAVIDGLLRKELGFGGVVMTDSLEAAAVLAVGDVEQSALASARAGVDVMLTTGRGSYIRVYRALLAEARRGRRLPPPGGRPAARVLAAQSSRDG